MTDDRIADLARRINSAGPTGAVAYIAGGGVEVLPMLLARGGGSATLLSARIPYNQEDFRAAIGCDPGKFVTPAAARTLAMAAFRHALTIRGDLPAEHVIGLGSTSKLSSGDGERAGRSHEIHAALQLPLASYLWSITLPEGRDRAWEERINALLLLNILAFGRLLGMDNLPLEHDGCELSWDACQFQYASGEDPMGDVLIGRRGWVAFDGPAIEYPGGESWFDRESREPPQLLLPGSFRPLHDGHVAMTEAASRLTGLPCGYELSLFHPEKPPLDFFALRSRLKHFERKECRLYLTNAPTYVEKARLFPGCTFALGHDTMQRIVDPRFYGGVTARDAMIVELESLGTRFLVFGRVDGSGQFRDFSPEEFDHPASGFLARVATPVPGHVFRIDISSTEIRARSADDHA